MVVIDNSKYEEAVEALGDRIDEARIGLSKEVFMEAAMLINYFPYLVVVDGTGNDLFTLRWEATSYVHSYKYTGELDLWFLNRYDTLILRDCNECSAELCLAALNQWNGKKIVFVGENWKYIIDLLPEMEGKECIWEDELSDRNAADYFFSEKYLDIRIGHPHQEPMDRYYKNIMTYDEVMTFTFLFANRQELGEKNPDKRFFIIDAGYENIGLFTIFNKAVSLALYAKKKGFIPVFRLTIEWGIKSIYQNFAGDDIWGKFFNQSEGYELDEVMESKNVYFPPILYNASIMQTIMDRYSAGTRLEWDDGIYNDSIKKYLAEKSRIFLPFPDKTLGVLARGTDFVNTHLPNHTIHASMKCVGDKIDELMKEWKLDYVFIATEDLDYFEYYKERFGDKAFFTDQERYKIRPGDLLANMHRRNPDRADGWQLGADYILAVYLLSRCNSFLASGGCSGVAEARKMNQGQWKNEFVFDLGTN
ncbi:MAG: hypothetical protein K5894_14785 [Lachnospiraceae bacterium]|nr:hypothetical protein [Lachnospiraceae bacterium]